MEDDNGRELDHSRRVWKEKAQAEVKKRLLKESDCKFFMLPTLSRVKTIMKLFFWYRESESP